MLPSSTVENYLKAIYQGQLQLASGVRLVSMGQVASALGVTPASFATSVRITAGAISGSTMVSIGTDSINLLRVVPGSIDMTDFKLAS